MSGTRVLQIQEQISAATACIAGSCIWLAPVTEWANLVATVIAIVAGGLAIYSHFRNRKRK